MGKKAVRTSAQPVHAAADVDDVDKLRALLAADGGLLEQRNKDGWTPLHTASYAGSTECVEFLLKAGAKPNAKCADGDTPAHYGAAQGHAAVLKMLAGAGADFEAVDNDGEARTAALTTRLSVFSNTTLAPRFFRE